MPNIVQDPWLLNSDGTPDPFASNVDWHMPDLPDPDESLPAGDPVLEPISELDPEIVVTPPVEPPPPEPEPEPETKTLELEDGTTLTLEKEKGQWKGVVSSVSGGNPQVYWGKTKDELILNVLKAQANATKKIREQNAKLKFGQAPAKPAQQPTQAPNVRALTADEVFEIKTQLESDPALALDTLFQKRTGLTVQQLVELAQRGAQKADYASNQLTAEAVNKTFLANNPDYYPDTNFENFGNLVKWIAKYKLGELVTPGQETSMFEKLVSSGVYTVENLEEAFQDLTDSDLLVKPKKPRQAPVTPETTPPVAVQHEPAPAPRPDPRIVHTETRPRAALGIQRSDVTPVKPKETNAPSVEDLDNLSDADVATLMAGIRRQRALSRRSN